MHLKEFVEHVIRFQTDVSEISIIEMYKKQIKHDVMSAFEISKPLIEKNYELFNKKPSFLSFLFALVDEKLQFLADDTISKNLNAPADDAELKISIQSFKSKHETLQKEHNNLKSDHAKLQEEYNKLKHEPAKLQEEYNNLKSEHTNLQEEYNNLKTKHTNLQEEYNVISEQEFQKLDNETIDNLKSKLEKSQQELVNLKKELSEFRTKMAKEKNITENLLAKSKQEIEELKAENKKCIQKLMDAEKNHNEEMDTKKKELQNKILELELVNARQTGQLQLADSRKEEFDKVVTEKIKSIQDEYLSKITNIQSQANIEKKLDEMNNFFKNEVSSFFKEVWVKKLTDEISKFSEKMNIFKVPESLDPNKYLESLIFNLMIHYVKLFDFASYLSQERGESLEKCMTYYDQHLSLPNPLNLSLQSPITNLPIQFSTNKTYSLEEVTHQQHIKLKQDVDMKEILELLEEGFASGSKKDTKYYTDIIETLKNKPNVIDETHKQELENQIKKLNDYKDQNKNYFKLYSDLKSQWIKEKETLEETISEQKKSFEAKISEQKTTHDAQMLELLTKHIREKQILHAEFEAEKQQLLKNLETCKAEANDKIKKLEQENEHLQLTIENSYSEDMKTDETPLTLKDEIESANYKKRNTKIFMKQPKKTIRKNKPVQASIDILRKKINRLKSEKNNLMLVNDSFQKKHKEEMDNLTELLNEEKFKNQSITEIFNKKISEKEQIISTQNSTINDKDIIINNQHADLQKLQKIIDESKKEHASLKLENEQLNSSVEKHLLKINQLQDQIKKIKSSQKSNFKSNEAKYKHPKRPVKDSFKSPVKKKPFEFSHPYFVEEPKTKYSFQDPIFEENYYFSNLQNELAEETENLFANSMEETNYEELLSRCIHDKDALTSEVEQYKQKLIECNKLIQDADYVIRKDTQENKLTEKNFKLLFIGFFKYHFKKLTNPNKINLNEDDKKLLSDLKTLMNELSNSKQDGLCHILCMYVNQQILSLTDFNVSAGIEEANTVEELLKYTLLQIETFIKDINIQQEFEKILNVEFSTYTISSETVFESKENIKHIFHYLKNIFDIYSIREMELTLQKISSLVDSAYPVYKQSREVDRRNFLQDLINEMITYIENNEEI